MKKPVHSDVSQDEAARHEYFYAVGRRKESVARVKLYVVGKNGVVVSGTTVLAGDILINGRPATSYFRGTVSQKLYLGPFHATETVGRFAVSAVIVGGGMSGQIGAFSHGVSRALLQVDAQAFRLPLKHGGFLTRDSRMKERRKAGFAQKARARKQSPKR